MLRISSGFRQTLENNGNTRPEASWFKVFSRVWIPDEPLALVLEIVLYKIKADNQNMNKTEMKQIVEWLYFTRETDNNI